MKRRQFLQTVLSLGGAAAFSPLLRLKADRMAPQMMSKVVLIKTKDRAVGVRKALELLNINPVSGKSVFLKPNYNSADPAPGSTHPAILTEVVRGLQTMGAAKITLGDRSGMGNTRGVLQTMEALSLGKKLGFETIVFDELRAGDWVKQNASFWKRGFAVPKALLDAGAVVQVCCLKTHRYGGHFTLSLKNSVGLAAKTIPGESYNYMTELHGSVNQRRMIAEINTVYNTDLIVMDGVQAFVDGGPDSGRIAEAGVILASTDRVAIDAVGVAILRHFGTTPAVSKGRVFEQEQIDQAVKFGIGVSSAEQMEIVTGDAESAAFAKTIQQILVA